MNERLWFYFGCVHGYGHYLWTIDFEHAWVAGPWDDRALDRAPGPNCLWHPHLNAPQIEGAAYLTHRDGWTALSFADRSVDSRTGSHSDFLTDATLDGETMLREARDAFPQIWRRFKFEVVVVG